MRSYIVIAEARRHGAIGEFARWRFNGVIASSEEEAMRKAMHLVRCQAHESRGAWVVMSRGPLTPEECEEHVVLEGSHV